MLFIGNELNKMAWNIANAFGVKGFVIQKDRGSFNLHINKERGYYIISFGFDGKSGLDIRIIEKVGGYYVSPLDRKIEIKVGNEAEIEDSSNRIIKALKTYGITQNVREL